MLTTNVLCLKKKRKKKSYYVANVSQYGGKPAIDKRSPGSAVPMMHITEDTPPDMLAGAMDLTVHLPTGRSVKLSVERSTPMMDLLVQITTTHNLQLSGHILQAMDMTRSGGIGDKVLPYKPNTPIGALDTQHIKVVPKNKASASVSKTTLLGHQPFESTFRLKVHLPRNQLYVTRVSQNVYLEEIIRKVCEEKGLDPVKYELRHPGNLDEVLDPNLTLSDYQITEIYVVGKGSGRLAQTFSSSDIMALRKEEERKQFQAKTGGGVFNLIFKRSKTAAPEPSPASIDNRSIPPTENSKPLTLPIVKEQPPQDRPKPPQRKRRPAPKPPTLQAPTEPKNPSVEANPHISGVSSTSTSKAENGLIICHSRNSSDSSGYHEASVLSENCNTSLPRRPKSIYDENGNRARVNGEHSKSTGNLEKMQTQSKSMSSLTVPARKKKAAPAPPKVVQKSEVDKVENASPVVASQPTEAVPESITTNITTSNTPPESLVVTSPQPQSVTSSIIAPVEDIKENQITLENKQTESENKSEPTDLDNKNEVDSGICENNLSDVAEKEDVIEKDVADDARKGDEEKDETDWQYQLPSPPKGFRDVSPSLRAYDSTSCETETVSDSVVTSPELFEKLRKVHDIQSIASDLPSVVSQEEIYEEKEICNKLTLENLEKRKSLVYNRELATSLKYAQSETFGDRRSTKSDVMVELEDIINNDKSSTLLKSTATSKSTIETKHDKHLPNFKISTYDTKKEKINIFEDETVRSNENFHKTTAIPNVVAPVMDKDHEENEDSVEQKAGNGSPQIGVNRSESFSGARLPSNPIRRSKSQVVLNKYKEVKQKNNAESVSKSNSLLDVSGLQSLEVMRIIQNKLSSSKDVISDVDQSEKEHISEKLEIPVQEPIEKKPAKESIPASTANNFTTTKRQHFQSPPCIELGSWSQRPKTEITLKEDTDYKHGTGTLKSTPISVYLNNSSSFNKKPSTTNIKIGKSDHTVTTQAHGSVVISINNEQKEPERVFNQFRNDTFRRPFEKVRPHSIAIDNHVPIVRSVELKKEFQDLPSKSITEITTNVIHFDNQPKSLSYVNLFNNNNGNINCNNNPERSTRKDPVARPVIRNNSFTPVVKGFRISNSDSDKKIWDCYKTLPNNKNLLAHESNVNRNVPFSQTNLRRTESAQSVNANSNSKTIFGNVVLRSSSNNARFVKPEHRHSVSVVPQAPPPPPVLPALKPMKRISIPVLSSAETRDELLMEIRNFGGKKGLKTTKS